MSRTLRAERRVEVLDNVLASASSIRAGALSLVRQREERGGLFDTGGWVRLSDDVMRPFLERWNLLLSARLEDDEISEGMASLQGAWSVVWAGQNAGERPPSPGTWAAIEEIAEIAERLGARARRLLPR